MKIYETGFLLAPNLSEDDTEKLITQMAEVISQREGKLIKQEKWGRRRMAYSIKRWSEAFYVFFHYEGRPDIPLELERRFKQTDTVLRYLTLQKEAKEATRRKRKKAAAAEPKEAAPEAPGERGGAESRPAEPESGEEVK
jgi:small subunit ribosomal protein S6